MRRNTECAPVIGGIARLRVETNTFARLTLVSPHVYVPELENVASADKRDAAHDRGKAPRRKCALHLRATSDATTSVRSNNINPSICERPGVMNGDLSAKFSFGISVASRLAAERAD